MQASGTTFACARCGNCCRWAGTVRVSPDEVDAIAAHLGVAVAEFTARYARLQPDRRGLSLAEEPGGACVFLDGAGGCAIQPVKPRQCRDFPVAWAVPDVENRCQALKNAANARPSG
jgi:uncharacterized protein